MRRALRENATCALMAALGCLACGWLALISPVWNDYETEAQPAFEALASGHLLGFLKLAPVYGGSLIERAPFALLPGLWGGGSLAVYRMVALPCLLVAALLGIWIVSWMRREGRSRLARALALGICVVNPIALLALEIGHPEELLGGCLCVAAGLLACAPEVGTRRALLAGLALGLAIANKQWAVLALGPVLLALPAARRGAFLGATIATAAAILAPLALGSGGHFAAGTGVIATPGSTIFQPWQVWWFFGHHGALVHGLFGNAKPGFRTAPAWAGQLSHPAILGVGAAVALLLWTRSRGRRLNADQALAALAMVLLARCVLDTWDTAYYTLPFLLALLAFEVRTRAQPPLLALECTVLVWVSSKWLPLHASPDLQSAIFLGWSLPLSAWLLARVLARAAPARVPTEERGARRAGDQETTVSSLGRRVRTSGPPERTTTRSSIRTPSASGR
jgi:Glycosyltransferase family 87